MKEFTKAEEEIMQVLWSLGPSFTKDIHAEIQKNKPVAFNTVSTLIRILEKKGMVEHIKFGRSYQYKATVEKSEYKRNIFQRFLNGYFGNSKEQFLSFFMKESEMDIEDINELMKHMDNDDKR
ncbi:MAG: BlaI/MecI/CopY family transcriptional regulator [Flavobacteriales bacterium]